MIVIKLKVQSKSIFYLVKAGRSNSRGIIWKSKNKSKRREEPFIPSTARPLSAQLSAPHRSLNQHHGTLSTSACTSLSAPSKQPRSLRLTAVSSCLRLPLSISHKSNKNLHVRDHQTETILSSVHLLIAGQIHRGAAVIVGRGAPLQ